MSTSLYFGMTANEIMQLKQQRDELLAALKNISNTALGHPYAGVTCGEIAREAIAKVESEK